MILNATLPKKDSADGSSASVRVRQLHAFAARSSNLVRRRRQGAGRKQTRRGAAGPDTRATDTKLTGFAFDRRQTKRQIRRSVDHRLEF